MKYLIEEEYSVVPRDEEGKRNLKEAKKQQIWAVGGGKGGVGKSLVTANTSIALARLGYRVVAVDLDLGGANLHTCLGVDIPEFTLGDFVQGRAETVDQVVVKTPMKNLFMISGAQDAVGIANIKNTEKKRVMDALKKLDCDFLLVDLGAGTSNNTVDFFLEADKGILTLLPEPTSIENTYRFIKSAYYRRLKTLQNLLDIHEMIEVAMDQKNERGIRTPSDLIREVTRISPHSGAILRAEITKFHPNIVINQVRTQADIDVGYSIVSVCKKYFGIDMDYLGYLDYDSSVWQSVRKKRPLLMEFPNSGLVSNFDRILHRLLDTKKHPVL
jgi:flagellar biosynthesis protein FlhG